MPIAEAVLDEAHAAFGDILTVLLGMREITRIPDCDSPGQAVCEQNLVELLPVSAVTSKSAMLANLLVRDDRD